MMSFTKTVVGALTVPFLITALAAATHITPTVVLRKQADVIRTTLDGAQQYFVRTVEIGKADRERLKGAVDFVPEEPSFDFYYGTNAAGDIAGVVLFPQVNTQHGPLEVGLVMGPEQAIQKVVVTKATVETKPWVLAAVRAGLLEGFEGERVGDDPAVALDRLSNQDLGKMPRYMADVAVTAVRRGLALYDVLYSQGEESPGESG